MDFSLDYTPEQEKFAEEVGSWLDENLPQDFSTRRDAQKMSHEEFKKRRAFAQKMGEKGWLYPTYPKEYGGGGLDNSHVMVISGELAKRDQSLPIVTDWTGLAAPAILVCATEEQKQKYLPAMLGGKALTWQLMTEPETGTDVASQKTKALRHVRDNDHFIINGQKIFVGGLFPPPEQFYLLSLSDTEAPRHQNLSSFIMPADLPGITIHPLDLFPLSTFAAVCGPSGATSEAVKNTVFFDDVRVHESCLIGEEGDGWKVTGATFAVEHGGGGAGRVPRNHMAEKFLAQCRDNPNIRSRIEENPSLLESVVNIYMFARVERLFTLRNAAGKGGGWGGPQIALFQKQGGAEFVNDMATVMGPHAFTAEGDWDLDDGIFEVGQRCGICQAPGGTPEAMKILISRALSIGR
ncbi:MAG: acyl-CoA dehydrogenase family protein [Candidatus Adiutricales bacterium]